MPEAFVHTPDTVPFERLSNWHYHPGDMLLEDVWSAHDRWHEGGRTLIWDDDVRIVWFREEWTVPRAWAGRALVLSIEVRNAFTLYVDGQAATAPHLLSRNADPDRTFRLVIRGDRVRRPGMIMRAEIHSFPREYAAWLDAKAALRALAPGRGLLLEDWRVHPEEPGTDFADPRLDHSAWHHRRLGEEWRERDSCYWYRTTVEVPEQIGSFPVEGSRLHVSASFNHSGSIWVDGEKKAEYARSFGDAVVTNHARVGARHVVALRVPTPWTGWVRDTYLAPEGLLAARKAYDSLLEMVTFWDHFFRDRPEPQLISPLCVLLTDLAQKRVSGPELTAALAETSDRLDRLIKTYSDDAPFLALPYLQLPSPGGIIVRAESPVARPAYLALRDCDGETVLIPDERLTRFHRFVANGLQPDTQYSYTVGAGNVTTEIHHFRTAPRTPRPITVLMWGDSHYGPSVLEGLADRIEEVQPDLLITAGDMVGDGVNENEWRDYVFHPLRRVAGNYPLHFPVGNHDHGSWRHRGRGDNPSLSERWEPSGHCWGNMPYGYSFDYAGVHFLFVDPLYGCTGDEAFVNLNRGTAQYDWLEQDLKNSRSAQWTILLVHEPPFCETWEGGYYDGQPELREHLVPLMEKYGVDLCVSGHAHTYERGIPHPPYDQETGEGNTVAYLITGGGGSLLDNRKYREWPQIDIPPHRVEHTEDFLKNDIGEYYRYHYCVLHIEPQRLECTAYWIRLDGSVVDTLDWFVLRKGVPRRG